MKSFYLANHNVAPRIKEAMRLGHPDGRYDNPFFPRLWPDRLDKGLDTLLKWKDPAGIFVCDMADLFGIGVPEEWTRQVLEIIASVSWHRFYLLTKQPQNIAKFNPLPDNCWMGVSVTNYDQMLKANDNLLWINANVKYISFEPLLDPICSKKDIAMDMVNLMVTETPISWIIIGAQTKPFIPPKKEWVKEIVEAADRAEVPVFLKNNLYPVFKHPDYQKGFNVPRWACARPGINTLRQELP